MERTYIKDLKAKIGQEVTLKGRLQTLRDQKSMQFLILPHPVTPKLMPPPS